MDKNTLKQLNSQLAASACKYLTLSLSSHHFFHTISLIEPEVRDKAFSTLQDLLIKQE